MPGMCNIRYFTPPFRRLKELSLEDQGLITRALLLLARLDMRPGPKSRAYGGLGFKGYGIGSRASGV